jgi:hypothetical protein
MNYHIFPQGARWGMRNSLKLQNCHLFYVHSCTSLYSWSLTYEHLYIQTAQEYISIRNNLHFSWQNVKCAGNIPTAAWHSLISMIGGSIPRLLCAVTHPLSGSLSTVSTWEWLDLQTALEHNPFCKSRIKCVLWIWSRAVEVKFIKFMSKYTLMDNKRNEEC